MFKILSAKDMFNKTQRQKRKELKEVKEFYLRRTENIIDKDSYKGNFSATISTSRYFKRRKLTEEEFGSIINYIKSLYEKKGYKVIVRNWGIYDINSPEAVSCYTEITIDWSQEEE